MHPEPMRFAALDRKARALQIVPREMLEARLSSCQHHLATGP